MKGVDAENAAGENNKQENIHGSKENVIVSSISISGSNGNESGSNPLSPLSGGSILEANASTPPAQIPFPSHIPPRSVCNLFNYSFN